MVTAVKDPETSSVAFPPSRTHHSTVAPPTERVASPIHPSPVWSSENLSSVIVPAPPHALFSPSSDATLTIGRADRDTRDGRNVPEPVASLLASAPSAYRRCRTVASRMHPTAPGAAASTPSSSGAASAAGGGEMTFVSVSVLNQSATVAGNNTNNNTSEELLSLSRSNSFENVAFATATTPTPVSARVSQRQLGALTKLVTSYVCNDEETHFPLSAETIRALLARRQERAKKRLLGEYT